MTLVSIIVLSALTLEICAASNGSIPFTKEVRVKRQQDRWSWGNAEERSPSEREFRSIIKELAPNMKPTAQDYDACALPTVPDFTAPGRRVSQVKCYEFIWHLANRNEEDSRTAACTGLHVGSPTATGGRSAFLGEFPHMAGIGWQASIGNWIFKCGGSLISSKFVLTAAHCTRVSPLDTTVADPVPKIVRVGDKSIIEERLHGETIAVTTEIARMIVHPAYNPPKKYFDIALFELKNDVKFSAYVQPACLWGLADTGNIVRATATGWGVIETRRYTISPELQAVDVELIKSDFCDRLLRRRCGRNWCGVSDHQLCAGNLTGGVDTCQGDSGGPLQVRINLPPSSQGPLHVVIGVTSFGIGCGLPNTPGVYTRVSSFVDWIESIVWP